MPPYADIIYALLEDEFPIRHPINQFVIRDSAVCIRNEFLSRVEHLNATASQIFLLCDGNHSIADIWRCMQRYFAYDDPQRGLSDILKTVRIMQRQGLVKKRTIQDNSERTQD